jgi:isopropylmalate/homocitrate/citramalate synthase
MPTSCSRRCPTGAAGGPLPRLVANQGLERAVAAGVTAMAVFTAASDAFTRHNIGMTVTESLVSFAPLLHEAGHAGWWRRGYVSTAFGCPYSGRVDPARAIAVGLALLELGVDEVCFGDTIGVAVPTQVRDMTGGALAAGIPLERIAYHFHDTRGTALANVVAGLEDSVGCFDASTGGTGGCPYAPGAAGNLATEDLVYLLDGLGVEHGVQLSGILFAAQFIADALAIPGLQGRAGRGWIRRHEAE